MRRVTGMYYAGICVTVEIEQLINIPQAKCSQAERAATLQNGFAYLLDKYFIVTQVCLKIDPCICTNRDIFVRKAGEKKK